MCLVIHGCFSKADAIPLSDFTLKLLLQRGPIRVLRASSVISPNMDLIIAVGKQKPFFYFKILKCLVSSHPKGYGMSSCLQM